MEASSPEVEKGYLPGKRLQLRFPRKWKRVPWKWNVVFTWYKVIIEISQEVEASSPEVERGILLVEGNN